MRCAGDLAICLVDLSEHVGRYVDGVHVGLGLGQRNLGYRMLLEFCLGKELYIVYERGKRER